MAGGTLLTITGEMFALFLGAKVWFSPPGDIAPFQGASDTGWGASAPASVADGVFRGRSLRCRTPAAAAAGTSRLEIALSGAGAAGVTRLNSTFFVYES